MKKLLMFLTATLMLVGLVLIGTACRQSTPASSGGSGSALFPEGTQGTKVPVAPPPAPPAVTHTVLIKTVKGDMVAELYGKDAPITVNNFVSLAKAHFYKGLTFHRVETNPGFELIQGGDPKGDGTGGSSKEIKLEISENLRHWEGALAMARSNDPNSASSQFYICNCEIPQLDGNYAVFGKVIKGLDVSKKIKVGDKIIDIVVQ